ncbi:hypothetical protein ABC977_08880 [Thioalkalicoccus limnaeus]|uniref:Right handed beta helix domain-containing protein n=1 Tax=Thioalkalicoccus limnaeus TaxID=120681 RepID=A0ABV4BDZ3_9GAMM
MIHQKPFQLLPLAFLTAIACLPEASTGATINASSCSQSHVSAAISSATNGDTVLVPQGTCSWSGLSISKPIYLKGAGVGRTNITISGNTVTKQSGGVIRISDFSFSKSGGGNASKGFSINGSWRNAQPVIFQNNAFTISNSGLFFLDVAGGVIIAGNSFSGGWDDSFIQPKDSRDTENSWGTADTMGTRDTNGILNHYIENNTFHGGTNQGIDADDATRVVYRYNTLTNSSFNSHGYASSSVGVRHWEVYNNIWIYDGPKGSPSQDDLSNQGWAIWIRGGTGVIFNNIIPDIRSSWWGDRQEFRFTIRGAEDHRPQGSCANVRYPVPRQLGQGHNGSSYVLDPIYIWSNTGPTDGQVGGWNWGNPCGLTWTNFYLENRDFYRGIAKPGYTPYPYPHPLTQAGLTPSPTEIPAPIIRIHD